MNGSQLPTLEQTSFDLPGLQFVHSGKVRDVYFFPSKIAAVATDRISAFDHILPRSVPSKGQVLNQMAAYFLEKCSDIVPVWLEATPDPNVSVGKRCEPIKIEMVVRGYLAGHAWRTYRSGKREICGLKMPDGMVQSQRFPEPLITPSTKADRGHDEDISREEILSSGLAEKKLYRMMESASLRLFALGQKMAMERGLLLVDTKYEFGIDQTGKLTLIDEVHTPDSSRYFLADEYNYRLKKGLDQNHLSKEFVREWLMENGFQGRKGDAMPQMTDEVVEEIRSKYIGLYERMTGQQFIPSTDRDISGRVERRLSAWSLDNMN